MVRRPIGRYAIEGNALYWCWDEMLTGCAVWGRPVRADLDRFLSLFDHVRNEFISPTCSFVIDLRALESVDMEEFAALEVGVAERLSAIVQRTGRQALIRPGGLVGALVEGFYGLIGAQVDSTTFVDLGPALSWLGRDEPQLVKLVDELVGQVAHGGALLARLRAWLGTQRFNATVDDAAVELGMSRRSLQRQLRAMATSFSAQVDLARLAAADALLRDSELKLELVAERVGLSSSQNLSTWYRRLRKVSPSEFRERGRR